jgi:hypothetical protein
MPKHSASCSARRGRTRRPGHARRNLARARGWNRFQPEVSDLAATVEELRRQGARVRSEIIAGVGGTQILLGTLPAIRSSCLSRRDPRPRSRQRPDVDTPEPTRVSLPASTCVGLTWAGNPGCYSMRDAHGTDHVVCGCCRGCGPGRACSGPTWSAAARVRWRSVRRRTSAALGAPDGRTRIECDGRVHCGCSWESVKEFPCRSAG